MYLITFPSVGLLGAAIQSALVCVSDASAITIYAMLSAAIYPIGCCSTKERVLKTVVGTLFWSGC